MNMPTSDQINAGLHHVYNSVGTAAAVLLFVGLSQGDTTALGVGVHQIGAGVASIAAGVATLIPVATALYAMWNNSPFSKLLNFKKNPQIDQVRAVAGTPMAALADAIPGNKITTAAKAVIALFAIAIAASLFAMPAHAQSKKKLLFPLPLSAPVAPAPPPAAPVSLADAVNQVLMQLSTTEATVVQNVIAALQVADDDASIVVTPAIPATAAVPATATTPAVAATPGTPAVLKDAISHACYPAQIQYLQSLPTLLTTNIPAPYNLIVLFQFKRDFVNLVLSGQLIPTYLKLGCAPLLGNEAAILAATLGIVGVGATALAPITAFAGTLGAAAVAFPGLSTLLAIIPK